MIIRLIIYLLLVSVVSTKAQSKYASELLKNIHKELVNKKINFIQSKPKIDTINPGKLRYIYHTDKNSIKILFRSDSTISHIGLNLFLNSDNENIYEKFIERCGLVGYYNLNVLKNFSRQREKTIILFNGRKIRKHKFYDFINVAQKTDISFEDNELTIVVSDSNNNNLKIITPVNYNFIMGMDKKELEAEWLYKLRHLKTGVVSANIDTVKLEQKIKLLNDSVYYLERKKIFQGLDQTLYFQKDSLSFRLLAANKFPILSIKNILNYPKLAEINIDSLNFHMYPNNIVHLKECFSSLDYLLSRDTEKFVGFEKQKNGNFIFLVLYYNSQFMFSHVLSLQINILDDNINQLLAKGDLYLNVRNDNIGNIFKKFKDKSRHFKISLTREEGK